MYKKSLAAVCFALLLILLTHKGVAAPLEVLPAMVGGQKNRQPISCSNITKQAQDWLEDETRQNRRFAGYIQSAQTQYQQWHESLEALEEKNNVWEAGFFSAMDETADHFEESSDTVNSDGGGDDEFLL